MNHKKQNQTEMHVSHIPEPPSVDDYIKFLEDVDNSHKSSYQSGNSSYQSGNSPYQSGNSPYQQDIYNQLPIITRSLVNKQIYDKIVFYPGKSPRDDMLYLSEEMTYLGIEPS